MIDREIGFVEITFIKLVGRDPGDDSPHEVWALVEFPSGLQTVVWDPESILFGYSSGEKIIIKLRGEYGSVEINPESRMKIVPVKPKPGSGYGGYILAYGKVLQAYPKKSDSIEISLDTGSVSLRIDCKNDKLEVKPGDFIKIHCLLTTDYEYYLKQNKQNR